MRKILTIMMLMGAAMVGRSQSVQLHYDLGHALYDGLSGRPNVTTTVDLYKPDKFGNTFFFTDIDYYGDGVAGAYWEFARELDLKKGSRWAAHMEYDGGVTSVERTDIASRIQHALLVGLAWNWHNGDFSRTFSLQGMYKQYFKGQHRKAFSSFQTTAVWGMELAKGLVTFSGFVDVWYDKDVNGNLVVNSEPQLWFNLDGLKGMKDIPLSVGTEVKINNNFVFNNEGRRNKFYVLPTIAAKWRF